MSSPSLTIRCHCGTVSQTVRLRPSPPLALCHCDTCRHSTGVLCTSYFPVEAFSVGDEVRRYSPSPRSDRYFCATCGSHVARSRQVDGDATAWEVATGVVVDSSADVNVVCASHAHVSDTKDGGLARWIDLPGRTPDFASLVAVAQEDNLQDTLEASCACGTVRLGISRPNAASRIPSRWLPDLTHADATTAEAIKSNPADEKWWIAADGKRYLAGTCACRSCRLISGFEIQTWAFVPRVNISIYLPDRGCVPLDFDALPEGVLRTHRSSPGACREFCAGCGATVFWRQEGKSDVVDVSVGLLRGKGARAEEWLSWWTGRVSFGEEAGTGRHGEAARTGMGIVRALERGMGVHAV